MANPRKSEDIRFQNYVTESAFSLSLSKAQVAELGRIGNEGVRANGGHTVASLRRKGLIVPDRDDCHAFANWRLSTAGKAVFDLLLVADLIGVEQKPFTNAA